MKVLSLWHPYAALAVYGFKRYETRPKAAPSTMKIGDRFGIASTKQIKTEQEACAEHPRLQRHYRDTGLPNWKDLPRGCIIGTVVLGESIKITTDMVMNLEEPEYVYGDWRIGRYAWPLSDPVLLKNPVPARGQQGIWEIDDNLIES